MSALARLLDDAVPPATWHICPRDKLPLSEEQRQLQFLQLIPFVAPGLLAFAIPNAARRTRWEVAKAKREGMRAGVADLHVCWNHGSGWLEFKSGTGSVEQSQRDWLDRMSRMGQRVAVVRTAEGAFRWLHSIGAPVDLKILEGLL
jgi:hypothetical protein